MTASAHRTAIETETAAKVVALIKQDSCWECCRRVLPEGHIKHATNCSRKRQSVAEAVRPPQTP